MNTIETVREFLGWCTLINFGVLALTAIGVITLRSTVSRIHARMFALEEREITQAYFQYMANYKIFILVFNLIPYLALRIMS